MKKLLLFPLLLLALYACSTDNEDLSDDQNTAFTTTGVQDTSGIVITSDVECLESITGKVHVDVSDGFNNPVVVFTTVAPGYLPSAAKFTVRVEIQPLSDCDDLNSDIGDLLAFRLLSPVQEITVSSTSIFVITDELPRCYKWRSVVDGISDEETNPVCTVASQWYEAPVF